MQADTMNDARRPTSEERILLVDDNPANLQVLMRTLEGKGYRLLVAKDGESALTIARKARPHLILLDIMMPEMDGFEVCRRLKADPQTRQTAVIFLSALDDTKDKVQGFALGAVDYITKPFQAEEVIARVEAHLTILRLRAQLGERNAALRELNENLELKVQEKSDELLRVRDAVIFAMAKLVETRDDDTGRHLERICRYVEILARQLAVSNPSLTEDWITTVSKTAALHDIGKVGVPDAILLKPGPLTPAEREIMELHPTIGGDTLLEIRENWGKTPFLARAIEITMGHHEKWDGTGYPFGIQGEAIALSARLVTLADVYDALTCKRIYKDGMPHEKVRRIIVEESGKSFDPGVVEAFLVCEDQFQEVARDIDMQSAAAEKPPGQADINRRKAF